MILFLKLCSSFWRTNLKVDPRTSSQRLWGIRKYFYLFLFFPSIMELYVFRVKFLIWQLGQWSLWCLGGIFLTNSWNYFSGKLTCLQNFSNSLINKHCRQWHLPPFFTCIKICFYIRTWKVNWQWFQNLLCGDLLAASCFLLQKIWIITIMTSNTFLQYLMRKYNLKTKIYLTDSCLHLKLVRGLRLTPETTFVPPATVYWSSCSRTMHSSIFNDPQQQFNFTEAKPKQNQEIKERKKKWATWINVSPCWVFLWLEQDSELAFYFVLVRFYQSSLGNDGFQNFKGWTLIRSSFNLLRERLPNAPLFRNGQYPIRRKRLRLLLNRSVLFLKTINRVTVLNSVNLISENAKYLEIVTL